MSEQWAEPEQPDAEKWPRLGALAAIPGRDGAWSIWSRGAFVQSPNDRGRWWLVPVDTTEAERAAQAVLLRETEFGPYVPDETDVLW